MSRPHVAHRRTNRSGGRDKTRLLIGWREAGQVTQTQMLRLRRRLRPYLRSDGSNTGDSSPLLNKSTFGEFQTVKTSSFQAPPMTSSLDGWVSMPTRRSTHFSEQRHIKEEKEIKKLQGERVVKTGRESTTTGRIHSSAAANPEKKKPPEVTNEAFSRLLRSLVNLKDPNKREKHLRDVGRSEASSWKLALLLAAAAVSC